MGVLIPHHNVSNTPFAKVKFGFCLVTPSLATAWLANNKRNRKVKQDTVDGYARDMKNGAWATNHQGGAFFDDGDLMDFQHRLMAVVKAGVAVLMVVSTGWPKKAPKQKTFTMDGVDRGCGRSLRDVLELTHGIPDARNIVKISSTFAGIVCGQKRIRKQTTDGVLAVVELFRDEFKWMDEHVSTTHGLRNVDVSATILLGLAVWPERTQEFYQQFKLGLNLTANSPVWHLRNFVASQRGNAWDAKTKLRNAVAHHLKLFVEKKPAGSLVSNSDAALLELIRLNDSRVKKIRDLFGGPDAPTQPKLTRKARVERLAVPVAEQKKFEATLKLLKDGDVGRIKFRRIALDRQSNSKAVTTEQAADLLKEIEIIDDWLENEQE